MKCQVIKQFRADLTRQILREYSPEQNNKDINGFIFNPSVFPVPPVPHFSSPQLNNPVVNKLDELIHKLSDVKNQLTNLENKHDNFELFINSKNQSDDLIKKDLKDISINQDLIKNDVKHNGLAIDRHENFFSKLIFPMFDDICSLIFSQNTGGKSRSIDADLKHKLERYCQQMKKVTEGNSASTQ